MRGCLQRVKSVYTRQAIGFAKMGAAASDGNDSVIMEHDAVIIRLSFALCRLQSKAKDDEDTQGEVQ
jgi:hypothetical protein